MSGALRCSSIATSHEGEGEGGATGDQSGTTASMDEPQLDHDVRRLKGDRSVVRAQRREFARLTDMAHDRNARGTAASGAGPHFVSANPQDPIATALLERDGALAALTRALAASRPQGQIAAVSGEAGVGKTTLLQALAARESQTTSFLWGACEALATPRPLGPLLDMGPDLGSELETLVAAAAPCRRFWVSSKSRHATRRCPRPVAGDGSPT